MKLTPAQKYLLSREMHDGKFICLYTTGDDRTARALAGKGLGWFTDFKPHYSWRRRDGYINHFTPNDTGRAVMASQQGSD